MKMEALRVILDPVLYIPELMHHVVLKEVPLHPKMGNSVTALMPGWTPCCIPASVAVGTHRRMQAPAPATQTAARAQVTLGQS